MRSTNGTSGTLGEPSDTEWPTGSARERIFRLHVIASGSKGNASVVEDRRTGAGILVDCGISKKAFLEGCGQTGFDPANLRAVVITHDHPDHTKGLGVVLRGLRKLGVEPAVYVEERARRASSEIRALEGAHDIRTLTVGGAFEVGPAADGVFQVGGAAVAARGAVAGDAVAAGDAAVAAEGAVTVVPFRTSHDAASSCGFRFEAGGDALGYITDSGIVPPEAHTCLSGCRILAIESNHDEYMLRTGPYPYLLKRRIASDYGHLSNQQCARELESLLWDGLEQVVAMHISQNNNTYELPVRTMGEVLAGRRHPAHAQCAWQSRPIRVE